MRGPSAILGTIPVMKSVGTGRTALAAFHDALVQLNLAQYNLVRLSSVLPSRTTIAESPPVGALVGGWGDRLYCVYARQDASHPGQEAWAGIGWVRRLDGGGGFLVEHEGATEDMVTTAVDTSLHDMTQHAPETFSTPEFVIQGARCGPLPVCSLVIAPFDIVPWGSGQ